MTLPKHLQIYLRLTDLIHFIIMFQNQCVPIQVSNMLCKIFELFRFDKLNISVGISEAVVEIHHDIVAFVSSIKRIDRGKGC